MGDYAAYVARPHKGKFDECLSFLLDNTSEVVDHRTIGLIMGVVKESAPGICKIKVSAFWQNMDIAMLGEDRYKPQTEDDYLRSGENEYP